MYGICKSSTVCVRKEPSHDSELVTELLFNDLYQVIEDGKDWLKIKMNYDGYEGWISRKQHADIQQVDYEELKCKPYRVVNNPVEVYDGKFLTFGTTVFDNHNQNQNHNQNKNPELNEMISNGLQLLGVPYRWGGRTVFGIDCSGFVQLCAKSIGIKLPRDASQQVKCGNDVYFLVEAQPGDLAFFENEEHHIVHVGIIIGGEKILHASGNVRIDHIDQTGIFNEELGKHTHFLAAIKRIV